MPGDQYAVLVHEHRVRPPPFAYRCSYFVDIGFAVKPRIGAVGYQPFDRPKLHPLRRPWSRGDGGLGFCQYHNSPLSGAPPEIIQKNGWTNQHQWFTFKFMANCKVGTDLITQPVI